MNSLPPAAPDGGSLGRSTALRLRPQVAHALAVVDFLPLAAAAPDPRLARRRPGASPGAGMLFAYWRCFHISHIVHNGSFRCSRWYLTRKRE